MIYELLGHYLFDGTNDTFNELELIKYHFDANNDTVWLQEYNY